MPSYKLIIRKMQAADLEKVIEIDQLSFSQPWPKRSFDFELKNNPAARLWVAEAYHSPNQKVICGVMVVWLVIDEAHIGTIAVHPEYRRKGVASMLLRSGLRSLQLEGARSVYLEVRRSNQGAQLLYQKFGFVLSSVRNGYYQNNGEDALLFTLNHLETRDFS